MMTLRLHIPSLIIGYWFCAFLNERNGKKLAEMVVEKKPTEEPPS